MARRRWRLVGKRVQVRGGVRCAAGTSDWWRMRSSCTSDCNVSLRSNARHIRCQPQGSDLESSERNSNDRSLKFHSSYTFTHLIRDALQPHVTLSPAQSTAADKKDSLCLSITLARVRRAREDRRGSSEAAGKRGVCHRRQRHTYHYDVYRESRVADSKSEQTAISVCVTRRQGLWTTGVISAYAFACLYDSHPKSPPVHPLPRDTDTLSAINLIVWSGPQIPWPESSRTYETRSACVSCS